MRIREAQIVACAFSAAIEIAKVFFDRYDEPVASGRRPRSCVVVPDHTDRARRHDALRLGWWNHPGLAPGTFEGLLTVRPASGNAELILEGELASGADARELLQRIAAFVERDWQRFVQSTPDVEACNARGRSGVAIV